MKSPNGRTDELIDSWTAATARPTPHFAPELTRRPRPTAALFAFALIVVVAIVGALAMGGYLHLPKDRPPTDPAALATSAIEAIRVAPGVRYSLTVAVQFNYGMMRLESTGEIDYRHGRFSGTANGGGGTAPMLMFGGPSSGAAVIADGVFVRTGAGPWERQPAASAGTMSDALRRLLDPVGISDAVDRMLEASAVDPVVHIAQCGPATCQVVRFTPSRQAIIALVSDVLESTSPLPDDLHPVVGDLFVDVSSGFPVRITTRATAGDTTIELTLNVELMDHAPSITAPIP